MGSIILKQSPDFDPRGYGYTKLSDLADAVGLFTVSRQEGAVLISDTKPAGKAAKKTAATGTRKRSAAKKAASNG